MDCTHHNYFTILNFHLADAFNQAARDTSKSLGWLKLDLLLISSKSFLKKITIFYVPINLTLYYINFGDFFLASLEKTKPSDKESFSTLETRLQKT